MSSIPGRATDQASSSSVWAPVPEGLWRWQVQQPIVAVDEKFSTPTRTKLKVQFPLILTDAEQARLKADYEAPPPGEEQSYRVRYTTGWSPGWIKDGRYNTTRMVDFLSMCFGTDNTKRFRQFMEQGGGPQTRQDNTIEEDMAVIQEWLGWWTELEVYGTITHELARDGSGKVFTVFAGPLAVGSLPGQKDPAYQAHGRGKLRMLVAESGDAPEPEAAVAPAMPQAQAIPLREKQTATVGAAPGTRTYKEIFGDEDPNDLPF